MLRAIQDRHQIAECQALFRRNLEGALPRRTLVHVGYQGGGATKRVWHDDRLWYAHRVDRIAPVPRYWNAFGLSLANTGSKGIVVEINPALEGCTTQVSGIFAKDADGKIVLLHTGKVGGGRSGVGKTAFTKFYPGEWTDVQLDLSRVVRAVAIGRLNDRAFARHLLQFVQEVDLFKRSIRHDRDDECDDFDRDQSQQREIESDEHLGRVQKRQLILARIGQGRFRKNLRRFERRCRISGVTSAKHLRASHIKPWARSTNEEKLDGNNGLLLAPHVDHLFDRGFISFSDGGRLLISSRLEKEVMLRWKIPHRLDTGTFNLRQRSYLKYHRRYVFLGE